MLNQTEARKLDLRNISVMEVILAIIVILVILFYVAGKDKVKIVEESDHLREKNSELEKEIEEQKMAVADLERLKKENRNLKEDNDFYKALASASPNRKKIEHIIQKMRVETRDLRSSNIRLREKISTLVQVAKTDGTGRGIDAPQCTVSNDVPERKWLATVKVENDLVYFEPDRKANSPKLKSVQGLDSLMKQSPMAKTTFERYSKSVLAWSKTNECRFYVRFVKNPLAPQADLLMVQEYFYTGIR